MLVAPRFVKGWHHPDVGVIYLALNLHIPKGICMDITKPAPGDVSE